MDARIFVVTIILLLAVRGFAHARGSRACHASCGKTYGTGTCESNSRCLCWWGHTGPNSKYIKSGKKKGMIEAAHCELNCHYTADYRNPSCIDGADSDSGSDGECSGDESD